MAWLVWSGVAWAFCGAWVTPDGTPLPNAASRVVVARNPGEVVLTLAADALGAPQDLALLVPVPPGLDADDVRVLDPAVLDALELWSAPRGVALSCADLDADTGGDSGGGTSPADDAVTVQAEFLVGAWELSVVAASGADGLAAWLGAQGMVVPEPVRPVLQDYLDAGQHFVAARVRLDALPDGAAWPEPLQLRYAAEGDSISLPVRLGATLSAGEQEVVAWVLTHPADGRVAVSNGVEGALPTECQRPEGTELAAYHAELLAQAFADAVWVTELATADAQDQPLPYATGPVPELAELGTSAASPFVTRLRFRFTPAEATQDFVLYPTRTQDRVLPVYLDPAPELDAWYPVCGQAPGDGSCAGGDDTGLSWGEPPTPATDTAAGAPAGSCAAAPGLVALALAAAARRSRR